MEGIAETICQIMGDIISLAEDVETTSKKKYGNELREIAGQLENIGYRIKGERKQLS